MPEIIQYEGQYYILAKSSIAEVQQRVLKHADTFAIFDRHGDIRPLGFEDQGLFCEGTRFLSRLHLKINGRSPLLLSSRIRQENDVLVVDLTNPDWVFPDGQIFPKGTFHLIRTIFLWEGTYHETMAAKNYGRGPVNVSVSLDIDADYVDIFEVRGLKRPQRGVLLDPHHTPNSITLGYRGLDHRIRRTICTASRPFDRGTAQQMDFDFRLESGQSSTLELSIAASIEDAPRVSMPLSTAYQQHQHAHAAYRHDRCRIDSSNEQLNTWLEQSRADLQLLVTDTGLGYYPFAGIPWYSTIFGRDGILTAFQMLWYAPNIARGVLAYLAKTQAIADDPLHDAEPGKILHETRKGEMAALHEIPFDAYYGSVDATPLFVWLAGHYFLRTNDLAFIHDLVPHIERALAWIDTSGDRDADGFVEYATRNEHGLRHHGWKDSHDAIFHRDGTSAIAPIALCEVQAYVYEAKLQAAHIFQAVDQMEKAATLRHAAERLKNEFIARFWNQEVGMYAMALDAQKRQCVVRSSNAGHALLTGVADPHQARVLAEHLVSPALFSGWGVRTIATTEVLYNPMAYHNGSIWPHDNALIAYGLARYGYKTAANQIFSGLLDASKFFDLARLPELFCGFERRPGEGPILYPVACNPQAWAAGAVFLLLQATLGLSIHAPTNTIIFQNPTLPEFINHLHIANLQLGPHHIDLTIHRHAHNVSVQVERREGDIAVVVRK